MIKVFVSYSRDDESLVAPIVRLLRVNTSYVFQDVDGIRPGKRWREEIARGIGESNLVVVFWCRHALLSASVSEEWTAAIDQKKDLLPLLLDATPLPKALSDFQYIDFRATVGDDHCREPANKAADPMPSTSTHAPASTRALPASAPKSSVRWLAFGGGAAALFAAVSLLMFWPQSREPVGSALPSPPAQTAPSTVQPSQAPSIEAEPQRPPLKEPSPPAPLQSTGTGSPWLIAALLAALALVAGVVWYARKNRGRPEPPDLTPRPSSRWESTGSFVERQMASEIKAEIARRTST